MTTIIVILILTAFYFIPSILAYRRRNHVAAIFAVNLIFGWTGIGYGVAVVMALWNNNSDQASTA